MASVRTYKRLARTNLLKDLKDMESLHEKMKGCYFWDPPSSAPQRRKMEEERSKLLEFVFEGKHYLLDQETICSCKNVYYSLAVYVDGRKKDVRTLRKLIASAPPSRQGCRG